MALDGALVAPAGPAARVAGSCNAIGTKPRLMMMRAPDGSRSGVITSHPASSTPSPPAWNTTVSYSCSNTPRAMTRKYS